MLIDGLQVVTAPSVYNDPNFHIVLEDHLTYFRLSDKTRLLEIEAFYAAKFSGDLFGLLYQYSVAPELHWLVMRMNGMTTPTDADENLHSIMIPDYSMVERIRSLYMTQNKIRV